jgi:predicted DNA-binding transcriptional regulator AlpA
MLAKGWLASPECAPVNENTLLSRKELAAALNVSTRTVDRRIHEQTGPPATLLPSGRRRWRWGDVETLAAPAARERVGAGHMQGTRQRTRVRGTDC